FKGDSYGNFSGTSNACNKGGGGAVGSATGESSGAAKPGGAPWSDARSSPVGTEDGRVPGAPGRAPPERGGEPQYQLSAPAAAAPRPALSLRPRGKIPRHRPQYREPDGVSRRWRQRRRQGRRIPGHGGAQDDR